MVYKLIVAEEAHADIEEVVAYIVHKLKNPGAAGGFLAEVEHCYRCIAENPQMYSFCSDESLQRKGYRKAVIGNYLALYRVDEAQKIVFIVRVIYASRDYVKLI